MSKKAFAVTCTAIILGSTVPRLLAVLFGLWIPLPNSNHNQGAVNTRLDASAEKLAFVGIASKSCTADRAGFLMAGIDTGDTMKVSFQDVDPATGNPDGVVDQFGTVVIADTDDSKWIDGTTSPAIGSITSGGNGAGSGRSVTVGDIVAVVIEFNSFVAGAMEFKSFEKQSPQWDPATNIYYTHFTAAWAKSDFVPAFAFGCSDGTYQYMESVTPFTGVMQIHTFNSGSAADEVALRFKIPYKNARLSKARAWMGGSGDADLVIYEGTTALGTFTLDKDIRFTTARNNVEGQYADIPLTMDTVYYVSLKPTSVTDITLNYNNVQSNAILDVVGGGREFYWASRVDAGAWTPLTTRRPFISIMITFEDGAGGGGGSSHVFGFLSPFKNLPPLVF